MEPGAEVEVLAPNPTSAIEYVIDREELLRLRVAGLIQDKLYVYLALKLTSTQSNPSIDILSHERTVGVNTNAVSNSNCPITQERGAATL